MGKKERTSFFKNPSDTLAIIGVNLVIAAVLITVLISNTHRIDASNVRSEQLSRNIITLIQELKDLDGRVCVIEAKTGNAR